MLVRIPRGGGLLAAADPSDVLLEPVKRSRIYEHIVEQIHALIREGRWAPGDQIPPERELAERFRVSRTSVREALRALEMQGGGRRATRFRPSVSSRNAFACPARRCV